MKPIKLVMTGFESYCEKTEVDFEKLGSSGLYLVSGVTGAGKTTIFDAITYALYGEPSGSHRSEETLRSHFADENIPTEVELTFEANGKKYLVNRNPTYPCLKNGKLTECKQNAVLKCISGEPVIIAQKKTKVTEEIENIIKLKKEQFCGIAMIAQGAFQELLLGNNEKKEKLFREIFNTEKYEKLEAVLKAKDREAVNEKKDLNNKKQTYLSNIAISPDDIKFEEIRKVKESGYVDEAVISLLEEFVNADKILLEEVKKDAENNDLLIEETNGRLNVCKERGNLIFNIEGFKQKLEAAKQNQTALDNNLKEAVENAAEKDELICQKNLLEGSLKKYEEIASEEKSLAEKRAVVVALENSIRKSEEKSESLSKEKSDYTAERNNLNNAGENKEHLVSEKNQLEEKCDNMKKLTANIHECIKTVSEYEIQKGKVVAAETEYGEANHIYEEKRRLFNLEQAGILADGLQEGMACPVCGSTTHPNLAVKSSEAPTEEEVNELEKKAASLQKLCGDVAAEAARLKGKKESEENAILEAAKKYAGDFISANKDFTLNDLSVEISAQLKNTEERIVEVSKEISAAEKNIKRKEELDNLLPEIETKISEIALKISGDLQKKASINSEIEANEKIISEKKAELQYATFAEAKAELVQLTSSITSLETAVTKATEAVNNGKQLIAGYKGSIDSYKTQLEKIPQYDKEALLSKKILLTEKKRNLTLKRDNLNSRGGINISSVENIKKLFPEIQAAEKKCNMINRLYTVINGNITGQEIISLENYIQMKYLDHITKRANKRLKVMSNNQYELRRAKEAGEKKKNHSLEINVKDFFTGKERNVGTLSGGETFQASLSLALGLADEIQCSAGGIRLETMFIDEGFGTLDSDTLDKAMRALEDLSKGNKLVGIISHREELEQRIANKIYVDKDENGHSYLKIVTAGA